MSNARHRTRGFTLLEVAIAIAIIAIVASLATRVVARSRDREDLGRASRQLVNAIREARSLGASGATIVIESTRPPCSPRSLCDSLSGPPTRSVDPATTRVRRAGLIVTRTGYSIFADDDGDPENGEATLKTVDLARDLGTAAEIVEPAPSTRIVFGQNGLRNQESIGRLVLLDPATGARHEVSISLAGIPRVATLNSVR